MARQNQRNSEHNGNLGEQALSELRAFRDELRLKLQLGEMDAAEAWEELRVHVDRLEELLKEALQSATAKPTGAAQELNLRWHLALMEARERWRTIEPRVRPVLDAVHPVLEAVQKARSGAGHVAKKAVDELRGALRDARSRD